MGGWSSERDVSLTSGRAVAKALAAGGYTVTEVDVTRDLSALVAALTPKPDVVFNALHGQFGEDGCIQGVLEILGIPYTHSGPLASALAMNKQKAKEILKPLGMPCAEGGIVSLDDLRAGRIPVSAPFVVKPNTEGSSVGVIIIKPGDNSLNAQLADWHFGEALVEKYIPGRELSVAAEGALGEKARGLTVTEIRTNIEFYNYEAKYSAGGSEHIIPAPIPADVFARALELAAFAHEKLGCSGISRTDFRYDDTQAGTAGLCYLETNTQPGMTPMSLVPEQSAYLGRDFTALVGWMVENARTYI